MQNISSTVICTFNLLNLNKLSLHRLCLSYMSLMSFSYKSRIIAALRGKCVNRVAYISAISPVSSDLWWLKYSPYSLPS